MGVASLRIRCKPSLGCFVFAYIVRNGRIGLGGSRCSRIYHLTWAGFTLLILIWRQCESLSDGIGAERDITPTSFFVSIFLSMVVEC